MNFLKIACYFSAAIHSVLTLALSILGILICVWYDSPQKIDIRIQDMPFWMWVLATIYFLFGFLSVISLMRGIAKDRHGLFNSFFSNMIVILLFITIRACVVMVIEIKESYSAGVVASEFFIALAIVVSSAIVMVPCFMQYKKLSGYSYFECLISCCSCCRASNCCRRREHRPIPATANAV